jgi:hypothetical protein
VDVWVEVPVVAIAAEVGLLLRLCLPLRERGITRRRKREDDSIGERIQAPSHHPFLLGGRSATSRARRRSLAAVHSHHERGQGLMRRGRAAVVGEGLGLLIFAASCSLPK